MAFRTLLAWLALALYAKAALAADPLVTLETTSALELCAACPQPQLRYLVVPKKGASVHTDEPPIVELVSLGALPREPYRGLLKATWEADSNQIPHAIDVAVTNSNPPMLAGLYDIYLNLQPKSQPDAPRLHIQFNKPAPKIATIPKLKIERTWYFFGKAGDYMPRLTIQETTRRSALTGVQFLKVNNTVLGSRQISGELAFRTSAISMGPGDARPIDYLIAGDFGLGLASGSVNILTGELEAPVGALDFEVSSRVWRFYLLVCIVLGLVASYFVKIRLQQKIELDQARVDAVGFEDRVKAEATRHHDPQFQQAFATQLDELDAAISQTDAKRINDDKQALDTAFQKALQDLANRRQAQQTIVDGLLDIIQTQWELPPSIRNAVEQAKASVAEIQALLRDDALEAVQQKLRERLGQFGNQLKASAPQWQTQWQSILLVLTGPKDGISTDIAAAMAPVIQQVRIILSKFDGDAALDSPEQIRQGLRDLQSGRSAVAGFTDWVSSAMAVEVATAKTKEPAAGNPSLFDAVQQQVDSFCIALRAMVDEPAPAAFPALLQALHQDWEAAIDGQLANPDAEVSRAITEHRYLDAIQLAAARRLQKAPATAIQTAAQAEEEQISRVPRPLVFPLWTVQPRGAAFLGIRSPAPTVTFGGGSHPTLVTATKQLMRDKLWLTIGVGVGLTAVGYGIFRDAWVGTFGDISSAFFWAFGLDLTIDTLLKVSKRP